MITQTELKELLNYNPETGVFTWKIQKANIIKVGDNAGSLENGGYINIKINKKIYKAYRLAWLYVHGDFPEKHIDHINGNPSNNAIENLRVVTRRENQQNRVEHRNGHLIGTTFNKHAKKWLSRININGKQKHLGCFETQQEAHEAYLNKLKELNYDNRT